MIHLKIVGKVIEKRPSNETVYLKNLAADINLSVAVRIASKLPLEPTVKRFFDAAVSINSDLDAIDFELSRFFCFSHGIVFLVDSGHRMSLSCRIRRFDLVQMSKYAFR